MQVAEVISSPAHYVANRVIQPIEVIEEWQLCHHLACALKYIARAGRKEDAYQDLQKAEWYISREISHYRHEFSKCQMRIIDGKEISPSQITVDWDLSSNLAQVLQHIKNARPITKRAKELLQARAYLQQEMNKYES